MHSGSQCFNFIFHPELPGSPSHVSILVTSTSSLFVSIKEPEGDTMGLITRYRGESSDKDKQNSTSDWKKVMEMCLMKNNRVGETVMLAGKPYFQGIYSPSLVSLFTVCGCINVIVFQPRVKKKNVCKTVNTKMFTSPVWGLCGARE